MLVITINSISNHAKPVRSNLTGGNINKSKAFVSRKRFFALAVPFPHVNRCSCAVGVIFEVS